MKSIIEYFLDKRIFINLLSVILLFVGFYKAVSMNREAFPNINFDIVMITTIFPGASPAEVEKLVTKNIEENLKSVDGLKEYRSSSLENRSGVIVTIDPNVKNPQKVIDDIKSAVDSVEDLPDDAKKPIVTELTSGRSPVIEVNLGVLEKDGVPVIDEKDHKRYTKILEDQLLAIPDVGRIVRRGYRNAEMHVDVDPISLDKFFISTELIINALRTKNINFPGGNISNEGMESIVRTVGEFDTPEEIEQVYVRSNDAGQNVQLKQIAKVKEDFEDAEYIDRVDGMRSIVLTVIKKEKGDAIYLVDKVKETVDNFRPTVKGKLDVFYVNDLSKYIRRRLAVLLSNGFTGFFLVVASLFFFLGWRISTMVALGLPLTIAMSFIALDYFGITLNLISMMGLIIVIGMLVDDAIVISENIFRLIEEGVPIQEACIRGTAEVASPVTATITTTIAAFGPLLFMTGIFGKFIFSIPFVVIIALCASLLEAFFVLPSHVYDVSKGMTRESPDAHEGKLFARFKHAVYKPVISWCLRHNVITILLLNIVFIFAIFLVVNFGKFKLFPGGVEIFQVKMEAPTGYTLVETEKLLSVIEKEVAKLPKNELENYVSRVGIIQKDPNDPFTKRGKNFAQIIVYLTPDADRKRDPEEIIQELRNKTFWIVKPENRKLPIVKDPDKQEKLTGIKAIIGKVQKEEKAPDVVVNAPTEYTHLEGKLLSLDYEKLQGGPPVGKPVAIELIGDDYTILRKIAEEYKTVMKGIKGVMDIGDDYMTGKDEIRIRIDEGLASRANVSILQIATAINTAYNGTVATKIKRADEEIDVRVRFPETYRNSIRSLDKLHVMNAMGNLIPISKLIRHDIQPSVVSINHLDGKRILTVTANVDDSVTTSREANTNIRETAKGIMDKYQEYRVRYGGENKDTEESMASLGRAFFIAFFVIFMILASLFSSLLQPIIIVAAIPFSAIGVIFAFISHNHYFSFLSMIGMVGLSGVVINDSIVLVDFANALRAKNPNATNLEIARDAALIRLRPVILTTVTTVLGILPTAYGIGGSDPFLVPMALAIGWGLAFASILIMLIIPVLFKTLYDIVDKVTGQKRGIVPVETDLPK
jgi:multidrug efflux pump subunit AcrB